MTANVNQNTGIPFGYISANKLDSEVVEIGRRRVGKECRSRWAPYPSQKKKDKHKQTTT